MTSWRINFASRSAKCQAGQAAIDAIRRREVRLCRDAEDGSVGDRPDRSAHVAGRRRIRVDAGINPGTGFAIRSMLAKTVAHRARPADAFARLTAALDETVVLGVVTNLRFLRWLSGSRWSSPARPAPTP